MKIHRLLISLRCTLGRFGRVLFEQHGLLAPDADKATVPKTLLEATQTGVAVEKKSGAMYDRLLEQAKAYPDLTQEFSNLRRASCDNHVPAFHRAAVGGGQSQTQSGWQIGRGFGLVCGFGQGQGRNGQPNQ